jgi:hypothetical protein
VDLHGPAQMRHERHPARGLGGPERRPAAQHRHPGEHGPVPQDVGGGEFQAALRPDPVVVELAGRVGRPVGHVVRRQEPPLGHLGGFLDEEVRLRVVVEIGLQEAVLDPRMGVEARPAVPQVVREERRLLPVERFGEAVEEGAPPARVEGGRVDLVDQRQQAGFIRDHLRKHSRHSCPSRTTLVFTS